MLVSEYEHFVATTDQFKDREPDDRWDIALYGLAGEVGSVVAAVKKRRLAEAGADAQGPHREIEEELGDALWYTFYLCMIRDQIGPGRLLAANLAFLRAEIVAEDARGQMIGRILDPTARVRFLDATATLADDVPIGFDEYQKLAFLTARTPPSTLVEVCLAVLVQLVAELLRSRLPPLELQLNRTLPDRPVVDVLGEVAWHLAALASVYGLGLAQVAEANRSKVNVRRVRGARTPLHDAGDPSAEQLPRSFEIQFVTFARGKARMYLDGRRLGDNVTDNYDDEDGYRYHDVMHLANAAVLGWSPVLRSLMGRKRRSDPRKDEVQDGARAKIVEEAVIKAIHSEGVRVADQGAGHAALFADRNDISFRFLTMIRTFVRGLDAERNAYWEWEEAIYRGHEVFAQLRGEGQGTVAVDLDKQTLVFRPEVCVELPGAVAGFGSAAIEAAVDEASLRAKVSETEAQRHAADEASALPDLIVRKAAILDALGMTADAAAYRSLDVIPLSGGRISVRGHGAVQDALWSRQIIRFRTSVTQSSGVLHCSAIGLADLG